MLEGIRADVCSHLPELPFTDMESFVKSHLPEMPDVPILNEMRSHLPDMAEMRSHIPSLPDTMAEMRSHMPNMNDVRSHISDMRHKLDDVRTRFQLDFDFKQPFTYIPTLSDHLENLHSHLSSVEIPSVPSFTPNTVISDLLESLLNSDVVKDILNSHPEEVIAEGEDMLERAAHEVKMAIQRSLDGAHLIRYSELPKPWQNNPFVTHGYR